MRPTAASHAAGTHAPARARTHSTLGLTAIANDQSLRFLSFIRSAPCRYHYPRNSRHAQRLSFLLRGSHPFLGRPLFLCFCFALRRPLFLSACFALRRAPRPPARKSKLSSAHTDDRRTKTRRAVRRHGWLDHCTTGEYGAYAHRRGGPLSLRPLSPSPYNAAVPKGPAFSFLNY